MRVVIAVDPGREKCGLAAVSETGLLEKGVSSRGEAVELALSMANEHGAHIIIMGNGTGSSGLYKELSAAADIPIQLVPEASTTIKARHRYFLDNPRRGIRRLIPVGLLTPDHPYDDYAALILAEEYLKSSESSLPHI